MECQRRHWPKHKRECVKAEKTPLGSGYNPILLSLSLFLLARRNSTLNSQFHFHLLSRPASHVPSTWVSHNLPMLMQKALQMRIHYTDMVIVLGTATSTYAL